jgi:hypothetical protein
VTDNPPTPSYDLPPLAVDTLMGFPVIYMETESWQDKIVLTDFRQWIELKLVKRDDENE